MILVIRHTAERNEYDHHGRLIEEKGEVFVSHGIDTNTGKTVIMPCDRWRDFQHACVFRDGEWYLR
jgi:hypothetical protein